MNNIIIAIICSLTITVIQAQNKTEKAILAILDKQVTAWNSGNMNEFMIGYVNNDSLLFIGKNGLTYGYEKTLNNYKKSYPDTTQMGKLHFTILQTKPLGKQHYFVVGKWHLARSVGNLQGHFSLVFKKIKGKWFIIADHSS